MATPTFILPSAPTYTEGFVNGLNVYPNPTNFVANQVPFTRATTATRTNAAGLIELTPYNLITWSEQLDNIAWSKTNTNVLPNLTNSPFGVLNADLVIPTTTNGEHNTNPPNAPLAPITNAETASIYAKASGYNFIGIRINVNSSWVVSFFDLINGVVISTGAGMTASIQSVGEGWYRCIVSYSLRTANGIQLIPSNNGVSITFAGDGNSGVFMWGAQLVEGTDALPYQLTETRLNRPRVDFSLGGCPNLLLEPQRTNLLVRSEEFNNASWFSSSGGVSVLANQAIAPNGQNQMDLITFTGNTQNLIQSVIVLNATQYTFSIWLATTSGTQTVQIGGIDINVWNTVTVTTTPTRFTITSTTTSTTRFPGIRSTGASSILAWGAQMELGAYPTTYVPTQAATVTRNLDVAQLTGAQTLIGQTEGTLYWEGTLTAGQADDIFYLNTSVTNSVFLYRATGVSNTILFRIYYGGSFITIGNATAYTGLVKIAAAYKSGDSVLYINGVQTGTSATAFAFTGALNDVVLNNSAYGFGNAAKRIKSAAIYNTRLTNAELATLTTP
jgi:hypothetical protein